VFFCALPADAQRRPVLSQIDLPHPYYYREMYLPQLTSGPSSVTWSPDSQEVIYSMGGSLWWQNIDSTTTQQLTDGSGYDYQPDWSPDGRTVVYSSYQGEAIELWQLDLATGKSWQLTDGGAVNVEPRWSPDGRKIVFVSTSYNKRFHIFAAAVQSGRLSGMTRLTEENRSSLPRYYYAAYDTEINPVWSRDGEDILFVSNRGHIYGTGGFWRMKAEPGAIPREIHYEETTWKARPDFSPDGSKIVYSSYLGRQWHQLWVMPSTSGDAFPVSYGDWDETYVRWSGDGRTLAFISNRSGNTELWLQTMPGGLQRQLIARERIFIRPHARVSLRVVDPTGALTAARVSITDTAGRFYSGLSSWISADTAFDRTERPFEAHYFPTAGSDQVEVPLGKINIEVMKGFEYALEHRTLDVGEGDQRLEIRLCPLASIPTDHSGRWVSADVHVHMNYGGTYRNAPAHLLQQAQAENLAVVSNLIVNKEQRIPDIVYAGKRTDPVSNGQTLVVHGQEFHTTQWGHLDLLNIRDNILLPGYAGYPDTAAASLLPMNADISDRAHAQGALVGYAHPFDEDPARIPRTQEDTPEEFAADVALGKVDFLEVVGFDDYRSTAEVWYRMLNLGFRIPAGAGTDAMANFASLRGPVGTDRVYAWVPNGPLQAEPWLDALKHGKTFASNGPLLDFSLGGQPIGGELKLSTPRTDVRYLVSLRSIVPVDHLELVCNGKVVQAFALNGERKSTQQTGTLTLHDSGWCLVRASSEKAEYPVLDNYIYATTSPVYVSIAGQIPRSPEDAKYFMDWIDRTIAIAERYPYWNSPEEMKRAVAKLREAQHLYERLR
jgi:Tol biopolymer transport system component